MICQTTVNSNVGSTTYSANIDKTPMLHITGHVREIRCRPVNSRQKGTAIRKAFPCNDVIVKYNFCKPDISSMVSTWSCLKCTAVLNWQGFCVKFIFLMKFPSIFFIFLPDDTAATFYSRKGNFEQNKDTNLSKPIQDVNSFPVM